MAQAVRAEVANRFRETVHRATGVVPKVDSDLVGSVSKEGDMGRTSLGDTNLGEDAKEHAKEEERVGGHAEKDIEAPAYGKDAVLGKDYFAMPTKRGQPIRGRVDGKLVEMTSQIQLYAM